MIKLLELPSEILHSIIAEIPRPDLLALRRSSKALCEFATPRAFETLCIDTDDEARYLSVPSSGIPSFVHSLVLCCPASKGAVTYFGPPTSKAHLTPVIASLQNLERVTWVYTSPLPLGTRFSGNSTLDIPQYRTDYNYSNVLFHPYSKPLLQSYVDPVTIALSRLPKLAEVTFSLTTRNPCLCDIVPSLSSFRNLTSLSVSLECPYSVDTVLESSIAPAVASSPSLESFTLLCNRQSKISSGAIDTLFAEPRTNLRLLSLNNFPISQQDNLPLLFPGLKSLRLYCEPDNSFDNPASQEALWTSLQEAELWLEELGTEGSSSDVRHQTALVQYLAAHPPNTISLIHLRDVTNSWFRQEEDAAIDVLEANARMFWEEVVGRQKDSLVELSVKSVYAGGWCYGVHASEVLRNCKAMRRLQIDVCHVDKCWAEGKAKEEGLERLEKSRNFKSHWGCMESCVALLLADLEVIGILRYNRSGRRSVKIGRGQRRPFQENENVRTRDLVPTVAINRMMSFVEEYKPGLLFLPRDERYTHSHGLSGPQELMRRVDGIVEVYV